MMISPAQKRAARWFWLLSSELVYPPGRRWGQCEADAGMCRGDLGRIRPCSAGTGWHMENGAAAAGEERADKGTAASIGRACPLTSSFLVLLPN